MDSPSELFHQASKNFHPHPADTGDDPEEWGITYYKSYPRLPKVPLPESETPVADLFRVIAKRRSSRHFSRTTLKKSELSLLLKYSCGIVTPAEPQSRKKRVYPSSGARFPIEVYPIIFRSGEDLKSGIYHYNVEQHALDVLWDRQFSDEDIGRIFTYPWAKDATLALVMTAVFWRNQNKYGERGYRYILLEAGHIGQNVYLICGALGLKCCAMGGARDKHLEELLDIDGVSESVVYSFAVGK